MTSKLISFYRFLPLFGTNSQRQVYIHISIGKKQVSENRETSKATNHKHNIHRRQDVEKDHHIKLSNIRLQNRERTQLLPYYKVGNWNKDIS